MELTYIREDFPSAVKDLRHVCKTTGPRREEACYLLGKALGRHGDIVGALDAYDRYIAGFPKGNYVNDARFFSAFLQYENRRYAAARKSFAKAQSGRWRKPARWYAAWSAYLAGDLATARGMFETIALEKPGSRAARRAAYWALRSLEKTNPEEALRRATSMISERPHDWYALMLRRRFPGRFADIPALPIAGSNAKTPWPPAFQAQTQEILALHRADLPGFAHRALSYLSPRLRAARMGDLEVRLALAIGDAERALKCTLRDSRFLDAGPTADSAAQWRAAYPRGFMDVVRPVAKTEGVAAGTVYSFIRKESAFQPNAVSRAHAVGLMQLLPKTAARILNSPHFPRDELPRWRPVGSNRVDLFDPDANVRFGAWYIARLKARFRGQMPLGAAAYNAGPISVIQWMKSNGRTDTDEFVERIPFREAREYVKRWVETRVAYAMIHEAQTMDGASSFISATLDLAIHPGVNF